MKIVIALDSFKGGLAAEAACRAVEKGRAWGLSKHLIGNE